MTLRDNAMSVLRYENYDKLPVIHFGFWDETLAKWAQEGHITEEEARGWGDGNPQDFSIGTKLGFDFGWYRCMTGNTKLYPPFERKVLKKRENGMIEVLNSDGVIMMEKPGVVSIPIELDHTLKNCDDWEREYKHRLQYTPDRWTSAAVPQGDTAPPFNKKGADYLMNDQNRELPVGLHAGSLIGFIRDMVGVENLSYLTVDDEDLLTEIIDTVADLSFNVVKEVLETGARFDFLHFWEDICYKNGPLVSPILFEEKVAPHYKRITDLAVNHGIEIISLDCDGMIDHLLPIWLKNGVNTMFPIEVGTWRASIAPWRKKYGRELRGIGGMDKVVFSRDFKAIDEEIERLKPLVDLGGFIPCPDHRIAPDAEWDNVRYYCDRMGKEFQGS
jgi:hypothetical protein